MAYKVVVDSCVDLNDEALGAQPPVERVPFTVTIDGQPYTDRDNQVIDQLNKIGFIAQQIRTASPSPNDFIQALNGARQAFIVTISQHLSGSYTSAMSAISELKEKYQGDCDIQVLDSESASAGESMVLMKLLSLMRENLPARGITERMQKYIASLKTLFVLENMDTLVANGRVRPVEGLAMKKLKICPIMGEDGHGRIELKALSRGKNRSFQKLIDMIGEGSKDLQDKLLGISHVNAREKAEELKQAIQERYKFKDVIIFEAGGLSSVYASNGGIVIAY